MDLRHILERESTGFADGLNKGLEEKGFRMTPWDSGLNSDVKRDSVY